MTFPDLEHLQLVIRVLTRALVLIPQCEAIRRDTSGELGLENKQMMDPK